MLTVSSVRIRHWEVGFRHSVRNCAKERVFPLLGSHEYIDPSMNVWNAFRPTEYLPMPRGSDQLKDDLIALGL